MENSDQFNYDGNKLDLLRWAKEHSSPEVKVLFDAYNGSRRAFLPSPQPDLHDAILSRLNQLKQSDTALTQDDTGNDDIQTVEKAVPIRNDAVPNPPPSSILPSQEARLLMSKLENSYDTGRIIPGARVTAFAAGKDNAYKDNPDGGDRIAFATGTSRINKKTGDGSAKLGEGNYNDPSSMVVHPDSGIAYGSKVYVTGMGWFVVEDHTGRIDEGKK